jgi:hypothetical protein
VKLQGVSARVVKHVRMGLGLFLLLLIYDGALRKWVLPGAEQLLYIAKDALLLGLLVYIPESAPAKKRINGPAARALLCCAPGSCWSQAIRATLRWV